MSKLAPLTGLLLFLLVLGLGFGLGPEAAAIAVAVLVVGVIVALLARQRGGAPAPAINPTFSAAEPESGSPGLAGLLLLALSVRLVAALVFNLSDFVIQVAPDAVGYARFGAHIANAWANPAADVTAMTGYKPSSFYQHLNGLVAYVLGGDVGLQLSVVNAFIGTWAAYNFAKLAALIYGPYAARRTFLYAAFFPSIVLWTSINLRDAWSFLVVSAVLLSAQRLRTRFSPRNLLVLIAALSLVPFIRAYLLALIVAALGLSYAFVRVRQLPYALLMMAGVILVAVLVVPQFGLQMDSDLQSQLELMNRMKRGLAHGASAYDYSADISTPAGALSYLPRGVSVFLFAPFPWSINSWRQAISFPETLVWYVVFVQAVLQVIRSARTELVKTALPACVILVLTVAYGLVEGNQGTAFRHRGHVMLVAFVFAGGYAASRRRAAAQAPIAAGAVQGQADGQPA